MALLAQAQLLPLQAQGVFAANLVPQQRDTDRRFDKKITLYAQQTELGKVLEEIEKQTTYVFVYADDEIGASRKISLQVKDNRLGDVLQMLLPPLNIRYELIDNKIILKPGNADAPTGEAQPVQEEVIINGRVVDNQGKPLANVNIRLQGTNTGTVTNEEGFFTLKVPPGQLNGTLLFTSVGYIPSSMNIEGRQRLTVGLTPDSKELSEVVVMAYGTQKRKDVTAAVSTINTKDLESRPVSNMFQALQGLAPNLIIQQNTAEPGSKINLNIRGVGSLTANTPLIIIDGIQAGTTGLQNLNPYDVESMTVLKDAASSAIYGSQAANGVIYITTKRGKRDEKPVVQYNGMYGWQMPTTLPRQVEGWEFMTLKNEALANSGKTPQFTPQQILDRYNKGSEPSVLREMVRRYTPQQNHSLSVTGGGKNTSYLLSMGYLNQGNMLQNSYLPPTQDFYYKRYNARANVSVQLSQYVKADVNIAYTKSYTRTHPFDMGILMRDAIRIPRVYPIMDSLGQYIVPALTSNSNFALLGLGGYKMNDVDNLLGGLDITVTPLEGLKFNFNASGNYNINNETRRINAFKYAAFNTTANPPPYNELHGQTFKDLNTSVYLTGEYEKNIGKHYARVQVGYRSDGVSENYGVRADRFGTINLDDEYAIGGGYIPKEDGTFDYAQIGTYNDIVNANEFALNSVFGRANYSYDDKYLGEFTWRYDGSSKLAPGYRWQFFPAFSLGWRITSEKFLETIRDRVGSVKFRFSWGEVGNSNIGGYNYLARVSYNRDNLPLWYSFNNTPARAALFSPYNESLRWETSAMTNYGIDADLFNNTLSVSFDYFNKMTRGIYRFEVVPGTAGVGSPLQNIGKVQNKGWELAITYRARTGSVNHAFNFNLADNLNKVIKFGKESISGSDFTYIVKEGFPIASYYGYRSNGLYQNLDDVKNAPKVPFAYNQQVRPGDIRFVDRNGDGVIDADDRYIFGNPFPRYTFGFTYNVTWRNFDFTMFWQGVGQRSQYLRGDIVEAFHNNEEHALVQHRDRWTPTNPDASYPRLTIGAAVANNVAYSDYWVFDTKYLRLKNLQLGYTLPQSLLKRVHVSSARIYFTSQNLLTILPERFRELGVDPEFTQFDDKLQFNNYNPIAGRSYPNAATFAFGLDLKF